MRKEVIGAACLLTFGEIVALFGLVAFGEHGESLAEWDELVVCDNLVGDAESTAGWELHGERDECNK